MPGWVAFSPDGRFVVCNGHGKDIAVFDTKTSQLYCELSGHSHPAVAAAFLPDGRLVSGGSERAVRLWDLNLRQQLAIWITAPADKTQNWVDEWVGFKPSGPFVGSQDLDRLVGWQSGGEVIIGQETTDRPRVKSLFQADPTLSSTQR
jgi:WD40 repeat protein